jgi:ubiquinol-cytochrome c reductase cytochrome c1 subunit
MRKLLIALLLAPALAFANSELHLDKAPDKTGDKAALQHGAKLFVNYCLNCHSASYMRYNRLQDIGLTEQQIKDNLLFTAEKTGETMRVAMQRADGITFFGAAPPDLTVIARARASESGSGADWLYTYLRTFYPDASRPSGWNNIAFPSVGMPHVLWELQGARSLTVEETRAVSDPKDAAKVVGFEKVVTKYDTDGTRTVEVEKLDGVAHHAETEYKWGDAKGGKLKPAEYDSAVADLVSFLVYMGEPVGSYRRHLGWIVLAVLGVLFVFAYALKREYWKDVH